MGPKFFQSYGSWQGLIIVGWQLRFRPFGFFICAADYKEISFVVFLPKEPVYLSCRCQVSIGPSGVNRSVVIHGVNIIGPVIIVYKGYNRGLLINIRVLELKEIPPQDNIVLRREYLGFNPSRLTTDLSQEDHESFGSQPFTVCNSNYQGCLRFSDLNPYTKFLEYPR